MYILINTWMPLQIKSHRADARRNLWDGAKDRNMTRTMTQGAGNMEKLQHVLLWTSFPQRFVKRNCLFLNYSGPLCQHRHSLKWCFQAILPFPSAFFLGCAVRVVAGKKAGEKSHWLSNVSTSLEAQMVKTSAYNAGNLSSIPGWGRFPGEGNGNPL